MHNFWRLTSTVFILLTLTVPVQAGERVRIVGSTAVYTFVTMVAERVGAVTPFPTPVVEATGTGGGIKIFCGGATSSHPVMVDTSRPMSDKELKYCKTNGVDQILELKIGYDGIVVGINPSQTPFELTLTELSQALSEQIEKDDKWIDNPYRKWSEINPRLPDSPITVLGPTSTLATREVFEDRVIQHGCRLYAQDSNKCQKTIREDGAFIEVAEYENVIVQKLDLKPQAVGFVSFGFYHQNPNQIKPLSIDGILPTIQTISDRSYPLSRPLFIYVKTDQLHKVPGLNEFLEEMLSENAAGEDGYLVDKGLIPLSQEERQEMRNRLAEALQKTAG